MPSDADKPEDTREPGDDTYAHLDGISDGCDCVEIWEELSERRADVDDT